MIRCNEEGKPVPIRQVPILGTLPLSDLVNGQIHRVTMKTITREEFARRYPKGDKQ